MIIPLPPIPRFWALVFMPEIPRTPGKTKQAYQGLRPDHFTGGEITDRLITEIQSGRALDETLIYNTFENVVFPAQPELRHYREHLWKIGVTNLHLAGSGYALFSVFNDREKAAEIQSRLKGQNLWCELTESIQ
jgi:4-diphosphocytidyl-2C-methyl-D-erythritol kinase